mgnify:FL=1
MVHVRQREQKDLLVARSRSIRAQKSIASLWVFLIELNKLESEVESSSSSS